MSDPGRVLPLLVAVLTGATAQAAAAADDAACPPSGASVSATLHLTLRWRAAAPAPAAAGGVPPAGSTGTGTGTGTSTSTRAAPGAVVSSTTTSVSPATTTTATALAPRLPEPIELSTANGQALSWSRTVLYNEPTWQAIWTAQGQGLVGGERAVPVTDRGWFCPHWPGGSNAVAVDYRISSDPLPANAGANAGANVGAGARADTAEVPRGWHRSGRVQAPLGAWVPLSPQPGALWDDGRRERAVTGQRVATDERGPATAVLEMRWLLEAAAPPPREPAARPSPRGGRR